MNLKERLMLMCLNSQQEARQQWARINMKQVALAAVLVFGTQAVMAAGGISGGFSQGKSIIEDITTGIISIIGSICVLLLIWQMIQGAMKKKDWMDVLVTCIWIVAIGAAGAFGIYLYEQGQKMKFN